MLIFFFNNQHLPTFPDGMMKTNLLYRYLRHVGFNVDTYLLYRYLLYTTFFIHCWLCHWYLAEKWSQLPNSACWVKPGIFAKIWGEENLWDIDGDLPMYPTKYVHNIYIYIHYQYIIIIINNNNDDNNNIYIYPVD